MVVSFLHDLGIIPNKGTGLENDPNLLQGQEFKQYNRLYLSILEPHLKSLQITSMPGISSLREAMENSNYINNNNNEAILVDMSAIENEFNKTLKIYSDTYKLFSEDILNKQNKNNDIKQYFGKVITTSDNNYIYVNDFGVTHRYSENTWNNKNSTCPDTAVNITTEELNKFTLNGDDMLSGQPCGFAGKNIKNIKTHEIAWVDIKGIKHVYSDNLWNSKNTTCDLPVKIVSEEIYNGIPSGSSMKKTDICDRLNVDPNLWKKLNELNTKLLVLAEALGQEIHNLEIKDNRLKYEMEREVDRLNNYTQSLREKQIVLKTNNSDTLDGKQESTYLNLQSRRLQYLVWIIVTITIVGIILHAFKNDNIENNFTILIALVFCLLILYYFSSWLYNKIIG